MYDKLTEIENLLTNNNVNEALNKITLLKELCFKSNFKKIYFLISLKILLKIFFELIHLGYLDYSHHLK